MSARSHSYTTLGPVYVAKFVFLSSHVLRMGCDDVERSTPMLIMYGLVISNELRLCNEHRCWLDHCNEEPKKKYKKLRK